ncbi:hypothetical protein VNI00_015383 [Paramarasmius palmivorus]|uniref:WW domain-containing protein n=1 Tax=Paramarasmius palmivorus TaxID=297713 RepID=A0AAW0BKY1_9AGAR
MTAIQAFLKVLRLFSQSNFLSSLLRVLWSFVARYATTIWTKSTTKSWGNHLAVTPSVMLQGTAITSASEAPSDLHSSSPNRLGVSTSSRDLGIEPCRPTLTSHDVRLSHSHTYCLTATSGNTNGSHITLAEDTVDFPGQGLSTASEAFRTIVPEGFGRYAREDIVLMQRTSYEIPLMTMRFDDGRLPPGWKEFLHPEGARYFMYEPKRLYTDANIYDSTILSHMSSFIWEYDQYIHRHNVHLSPHVNVVFDLSIDSEEEVRCKYYLVDHSTRMVFWLDTFELNESTLYAWSEVKGVTEVAHIRHVIEAQYHCDLFPNSFSLSLSHVDELRDILVHSMGDVLTSLSSTVYYTIDELRHMLVVVNNIRKNVESTTCVSPYSRLMSAFAGQRFCHFHGQPAARLDRHRSVHYPASYNAPRTFMHILSPLMLNSPNTHYHTLGKLWVDGILHASSWNEFISDMTIEWQQSILLGTVLLNANVAFLAIQSVDEGTANPDRSPAQIASYLSIVASIGSVIIGLIMTRRNKGDLKQASALLLHSFPKNKQGLEALAILYSLPNALLMWGVILFLVAFSIACLFDSSITVRLLVCGAWLVITLALVYCIFILAILDGHTNPWSKLIDTARAAVKFCKQSLVAFGTRNAERTHRPSRLLARDRRANASV